MCNKTCVVNNKLSFCIQIKLTTENILVNLKHFIGKLNSFYYIYIHIYLYICVCVITWQKCFNSLQVFGITWLPTKLCQEVYWPEICFAGQYTSWKLLVQKYPSNWCIFCWCITSGEVIGLFYGVKWICLGHTFCSFLNPVTEMYYCNINGNAQLMATK